MKKTIVVICTVIGLLELTVIVAYFCVFNGTISSANQDWDTFIQIFNGLVMAILTAINIYIFYQLTVAIEDKNHKRAVKEKVFEAQSIITQMRVKKYEDVSRLMYDVIAVITHKANDNGEKLLLKKKLVEIDESLLFKNYKLDDTSILSPTSANIIADIERIENLAGGVKIDSLISNMTNYLKLMETYIIGQMIIDKDVEEYVTNNKSNIDCTMSCVVQVLEKTSKEIDKLESLDKES